jgi:hypothetical protein
MKILRALSRPLQMIAAVGSGFSLVLHLAAIAGLVWQSTAVFLVMYGGAMFVILPASLLIQDRVRGFAGPVRVFKASTIGCPYWMKAANLGVMGYFIVTFIFMAGTHPSAKSAVNAMQPWEYQMFSAWALAMYFGAFTMFYSTVRERELGLLRSCSNGHRVSATADYCERCGVAVR